MKLVFVCVRHEPHLWSLLDRFQTENWIRIKETPDGITALVMCTAVQEVAGGFLRLELAPATESPPRLFDAISVPSDSVAWMAEAIPEQRMGFLGAWDWPFPSGQPTNPDQDAEAAN
ncbi:hypothetical protein WK62_05305 [Burkholderia ubonensis]|uniref:hypothetical protein n=1 Tax=Burkholderia ubonensis TaxID=101571 RepID=UPI000752645B|nr:hypothetical protein [Burkholderia ubonensis]KVU10682.1 hypothetical protein WK62_05305 [Burkholderia ubonensis]